MHENIYIETSSLLAFILEGEPQIGQMLRGAKRLVTLSLTFVEADRAIHRAVHEGRLSAKQQSEARRVLRDTTSASEVMVMDAHLIERSKGHFPAEPIRTLDALHVTSALMWNELLGHVPVLTSDKRVRDNVVALGLVLAEP